MALPDRFLWGGSLFANQREGTWDVEGKGSYDRFRKDSFWWFQRLIATNGASAHEE